MRSRWPRTITLSAALAAALCGCRRERANPQDCAAILDRIVELELEEQGFRDETLAARKKREMRSLLQTDLRRCTRRRLKPSALACIAATRTTKKINHVCLR